VLFSTSMTVNFKIDDNFGLSYDGRHIDLHNNFDFVGYDYKIADRTLTLTWTKSIGEWVSQDEFLKLSLFHSNVFFLRIGYDNKEYEYPDDDKCLGSVSFFPSSDREINNGYVYQSLPKEGDDIIYSFQTEHFIRVGCDKIKLVVE
jgi:hypothetical protein